MLSRDYGIVGLCSLMGISRSGFYKWKRREPSGRDLTREQVVRLVSEVHASHSTHGYRWTAAYIRINRHVGISDSYAYKCFRFLGIKSQTRHKAHYRPRKTRDRYPNLIFSAWETVDRPRQVIVSDMTAIKYWIFYFELTLYFDVFTKEILSWRLAERRGSRDQYIGGLEDVVELLRGHAGPAVVHTDQGSVYSSMAYNELIRDTNSGPATPSDTTPRQITGSVFTGENCPAGTHSKAGCSLPNRSSSRRDVCSPIQGKIARMCPLFPSATNF